ncbi:MAG: hypothetical protein IAI49_02755 [Candidatus Eremiobacteraeota bacterium]|nr:hypothetical protein [Candidatus Eremiobacteraeota bacterium]
MRLSAVGGVVAALLFGGRADGGLGAVAILLTAFLAVSAIFAFSSALRGAQGAPAAAPLVTQ